MTAYVHSVAVVLYGARNSADKVLFLKYYGLYVGVTEQTVCRRKSGGSRADYDRCLLVFVHYIFSFRELFRTFILLYHIPAD